MVKTKSTLCVQSPNELLAEGTSKGNYCLASGSQRLEAKVLSTSSSSFSVGPSASSSSEEPLTSSSSDRVSASYCS